MSLRYTLIGLAIDRLGRADEALAEHGATPATLRAYQLAATALAWAGCANTARFAAKRAERVLELLGTIELDVVESHWAGILPGLAQWVVLDAATGEPLGQGMQAPHSSRSSATEVLL